MKSQTMEWIACRMCSFPITTYSVFVRLLDFLLILFDVLKNIHHTLPLQASSVWGFFGGGEGGCWWGGGWVSLLFCFLIFPVCSAHLFTLKWECCSLNSNTTCFTFFFVMQKNRGEKRLLSLETCWISLSSI